MIIHDTIALVGSGTVAVSFNSKKNGTDNANRGTITKPQELKTDLKVAPWGGDNLYPQNVTAELSACGVARSALDLKAKALYGQGIVYGTIEGYDDKGCEKFKPAQPGDFPEIDDFFYDNDNFFRFFLEFNQDWVTFGNCFPELIFSKDRKKITKIIHQESSDCRFKQMNDEGIIDTVYISKFWAGVDAQYVKASKEDTLKAPVKDAKKLPKEEVDGDIVKELRSIDMYNALEDLRAASKQALLNVKMNSVILPVNYPSPGKTYYQSPVWDAVRLSGWMEIASKVPEMLKALYTNAFNIKYHIQIPDQYFEKRIKGWLELDDETKKKHQKEFVQSLDTFMAGSENGYKNLVTFFEISLHDKKEFGKVIITPLENKSNVEKDLLLSSSINQEILFALQINPNMIGAGAPGGAYTGGAGSGSDIREAFLVLNTLLFPERQVILEPIKLAHKFNGWPREVVYRFKDIVLTTLDNNSGTEKIVS